jgi:hypothetical protein
MHGPRGRAPHSPGREPKVKQMFDNIRAKLVNAKYAVAAAIPAMAVLPLFDATSDSINSWLPVIVTFAMLGIMIKFMNKTTSQ